MHRDPFWHAAAHLFVMFYPEISSLRPGREELNKRELLILDSEWNVPVFGVIMVSIIDYDFRDSFVILLDFDLFDFVLLNIGKGKMLLNIKEKSLIMV